MAGTTYAWSTNEVSRSRNSFNAIVKQQHFDAPEDDMKYVSMGRQAEFGPGWVPNPIIARVRAGTLTPSRASTYSQLPARTQSPKSPDMSGSFGAMSMRATLHREMTLAASQDLESRPATPGSQVATPKSAMSLGMLRSNSSPGLGAGILQARRGVALEPVKGGPASPGGMSALDTTFEGGSPTSRGSLGSPMSASMRTPLARVGDADQTTSWSVAEMSVYRNSLNQLVCPAKTKLDTPAALMMHAQMGRKAEYDGNFTPNAIYARRQNGTLRT